ncbi:uncharacterized protein EI90DRAFT_3031622 [Cantharellus anzutake]|uniref:uncharacterized protein n=1 Tax=Cantharellus anzutake TaxID=1750568 RepID=UPI0019069A37|nr:uncharacterized protein EI90DRAFT_3031622 [Cantharellus anzutake]KAF8343176.1 hypothetical protein EI90DRAFT_3031622 [Cantharellus anzutake]
MKAHLEGDGLPSSLNTAMRLLCNEDCARHDWVIIRKIFIFLSSLTADSWIGINVTLRRSVRTSPLGALIHCLCNFRFAFEFSSSDLVRLPPFYVRGPMMVTPRSSSCPSPRVNFPSFFAPLGGGLIAGCSFVSVLFTHLSVNPPCPTSLASNLLTDALFLQLQSLISTSHESDIWIQHAALCGSPSRSFVFK